MIIDIHGHIGRVSSSCEFIEPGQCVDAAALISNMDRLGIDKTCVLPLSDTPEGWYLQSSTEDVIAACSQYPDRLIPFCLVDPRFGSNTPNTDFSDLLAEYKERGCKGIGEVIVPLPFDDPKLMNLYSYAGQASLPVLFDMDIGGCYGVLDEPGLVRLERALQAYPQTMFIGHGPAFWTEISGDDVHQGFPSGPVIANGPIPRLMSQYDNLWADLSAGSGYNAITRDRNFGLEFLDQFQNKLMFGTDAVTRNEDSPIMCYLKKIHDEKNLCEKAYQKIVADNTIRLLGL